MSSGSAASAVPSGTCSRSFPHSARAGSTPVSSGSTTPNAARQPFYEALAGRDVPFERLPWPRDVDPRLARRSRARDARSPARRRPHAPDPRRRLRRVRRRALRRDARLDEAQRRPVPLGQRSLPREAAHAPRRARDLHHGGARPLQPRRRRPARRKLRVVHYGLDAPPAPWGPPGGPDLPAEAPVLLAVCRLVPQKGVDVAIEALARIRERHPDAHLVVLGEGPAASGALRARGARGVADAVSLPGRVGDVAWWLAAPPWSSIPRAGRASVSPSSRRCSASARRRDQRSAPSPRSSPTARPACSCPPDDPARLAETVVSLLDDPVRARRAGRGGRARARAEFSVARMAERTAEVYEEALSSSRR